MSKAYVPPSMRRFDAVEPKSYEPSTRWTYTSRDSAGKEQALTNTSLASKHAPELAPVLIAPSSRVKAKVSLSSEEEFPSMGSKASAAKPSTAWAAKPSFASLSRDWAMKQKEEEEAAKKEAEYRASVERERRAQQEKEEKERRVFQQIHVTRYVDTRRRDDDAKYDMGGSRDVLEEDTDSSEPESYVDEEVEEEVVDDTWERGRNKHDYY